MFDMESKKAPSERIVHGRVSKHGWMRGKARMHQFPLALCCRRGGLSRTIILKYFGFSRPTLSTTQVLDRWELISVTLDVQHGIHQGATSAPHQRHHGATFALCAWWNFELSSAKSAPLPPRVNKCAYEANEKAPNVRALNLGLAYCKERAPSNYCTEWGQKWKHDGKWG